MGSQVPPYKSSSREIKWSCFSRENFILLPTACHLLPTAWGRLPILSCFWWFWIKHKWKNFIVLFCGINQINRGNQEGFILVFLQSLCTGFGIAHTTTVFFFFWVQLSFYPTFMQSSSVVVSLFFLFSFFKFYVCMVFYQLLDLYIHFCFINISIVQILFVTNEKKKKKSNFLAYTLRHRVLSLCLSLMECARLIIYGHMR